MTAPRRRGRPSLTEGEPSVQVHTRLPNADYDRAYARARRDRVTLAEVCRRAVQRALRDEDEGDDE